MKQERLCWLYHKRGYACCQAVHAGESETVAACIGLEGGTSCEAMTHCVLPDGGRCVTASFYHQRCALLRKCISDQVALTKIAKSQILGLGV